MSEEIKTNVAKYVVPIWHKTNLSIDEAVEYSGIGRERLRKITRLIFDGEKLPLPDSYDVEMKDVEADSGGETEAGTIQRDVVRHGVVSIPVSFSVTKAWLMKLGVYAKKDKIQVQYFDPVTAELVSTEMYVDGFKAKLEKDTSYKGLWTVGFTLREM